MQSAAIPAQQAPESRTITLDRSVRGNRRLPRLVDQAVHTIIGEAAAPRR